MGRVPVSAQQRRGVPAGTSHHCREDILRGLSWVLLFSKCLPTFQNSAKVAISRELQELLNVANTALFGLVQSSRNPRSRAGWLPLAPCTCASDLDPKRKQFQDLHLFCVTIISTSSF